MTTPRLLILTPILLVLSAGCGDDDSNPCTLLDNGDGTSTLTCGDIDVTVGGGDRSCSVTDNGDGTSTITCDDGTSTTVGGDDSCSIAANGDGTSTITCDDGTSVVVGQQYVTRVSGTVQPGDTLTLTHGYSSAAILAHYEEDGQLYELADYPERHSPVTRAPVTITVGEVDSGRMRSAALSTGDIAVIWAYDNGPGYTVMHNIVDTDGVTVVAATEIVQAGSIDTVQVAALINGGYVLGWHVENDFWLQRYDSAGAAQGAPITHDDIIDRSRTLALTGTSDGGFAVAYGATGPPYYQRIRRYNGDGSPNGAPTDILLGDDDAPVGDPASLKGLDDGRLLLVHTGFAADEQIEAVFIDAAGTPGTPHILGYSYNQAHCIAKAPNGNILVSYELGGPDSAMYVMFDDNESIIAGPSLFTADEPSRFGCGVFGDGHFAMLMLEGDSLAGALYNIGNDGYLWPGFSLWSGVHGPGYGAPQTVTLSNSDIDVIFVGYEARLGAQLLHVTKGFLPVETLSATQVQVTNWAADPVDVSLTAVGTYQ